MVTSNNKRIAKNSIYLTIRMIIVLVVSLYTTRVIIDALGVEDYGIYNVVAGFVSMFTFLSSAMNNGIQRFYNFELGRNGDFGVKIVYNVSLRVQLALAILLFVSIGFIGWWYIGHKMVLPPGRIIDAEWLFLSAMFSLAFVMLQVPYSAVVIAKERMSFYSIMSILNTLLALLIAILIKHSSLNHLVLYGALLALAQFVMLMIYYIYTRHQFKEIRIERKSDRTLLKSILGFSGWNLFGTFGGVMKEQGTNLILNLFCGPVVNAARGVAAQVNGGFQSLVSNLNTAVRPQVTQSYSQGDIDRTMRLTYSSSKLSSMALFMFSYPIMLEIDYILSVWLGKNIPDDTAIFIIIVVLCSFFGNLNSGVSGVVHSTGKMKWYQIVGSIINLIALPIVYFLLFMGFSAEVAMWSLLLIAGLTQLAALIVLKKIIKYSLKDYWTEVVWPIMLVCGVSILPPYLIHHYMQPGFSRFITVFIFSILEIGLVIYILGLTKSERTLMLSTVHIQKNNKNG